MKDFGEWIENNKHLLDGDVSGLFIDSYKCYKNDIDRPAYLLAYQGMMQYVRLTVLQSPNRPDGYAEKEWEDQWLKPLRDDDKWDGAAFICTQTKEDASKNKAAVMNISKEAREKFPFWRQFRNVCAHYKGYDLHRAHTLSLYSFIEQYLFTFCVEGGQASLNREFDDYYNPALTSSHADIRPLLDKIDTVLLDGEFTRFFKETSKSCCKYARFTNRFHEFIHQVIEYCPKRVKEEMVKYVQSDDNLRDDYLDHYPEDILTVLTGTTNIHNFWYTRLPYERKKLIMLALLLEADYIPDSDKKEAMYKCISNAEEYSTNTDYAGIRKEFAKVLADNGYFNMFYDRYFNPEYTSRNKGPICYKTDFYIGTISLIPWDKKYVEQLIAVFSVLYPFTLRDRLRDMYQKDAEYKAIIDKICVVEGLTLPADIV